MKTLALTAAGVAMRARVIEQLGEPPEPIARLSAEDQQALCSILRRALGRS